MSKNGSDAILENDTEQNVYFKNSASFGVIKELCCNCSTIIFKVYNSDSELEIIDVMFNVVIYISHLYSIITANKLILAEPFLLTTQK